MDSLNDVLEVESSVANDDYERGLEENSVVRFAKEVSERCIETQREIKRSEIRKRYMAEFGTENPASFHEADNDDVQRRFPQIVAEDLSEDKVENDFWDGFSNEEIEIYFSNYEKTASESFEFSGREGAGDLEKDVEESMEATGIFEYYQR